MTYQFKRKVQMASEMSEALGFVEFLSNKEFLCSSWARSIVKMELPIEGAGGEIMGAGGKPLEGARAGTSWPGEIPSFAHLHA